MFFDLQNFILFLHQLSKSTDKILSKHHLPTENQVDCDIQFKVGL